MGPDFWLPISLCVNRRRYVDLETVRVRREGTVLFADIAFPPMNLLGTELVRDLVSLIQHAEADERAMHSCSRAPIPTTSFRTST